LLISLATALLVVCCSTQGANGACVINTCMSLPANQHHNIFVNGLVQHKLNLTLQEYRGMHKQSSRGQLPHNKLIYPETLRYLSLWVLGDATSFVTF